MRAMNNLRTRKILRNVFFGFLGLLAIGGIAIAMTDSSERDTSGYTVVSEDTSGNQRRIVLEVDSADKAEAAFNDITGSLTDEAGYIVSINCSTGGTDTTDNRLANGRYAIGNIGAATTGLADGEKEFERVDGATCP